MNEFVARNGIIALSNSQVTGSVAVSGNLTVGSTNSGNAGTINVSVGVAGTTAGGLQLWAATNQTHYLQFGDGTTGAQVYAGYVGYAHSTDTLSLGTAGADKLTIASTGAATFSSTIRSNNTYGLGLGDIAGYRRIQYGSDNATSFTFLTDANGYAGLYAGAATFSSSVGINGVGPTYPLYVKTGTNQRARFVDNGGIFQFGVLNDAESGYSDMSLGNSSIVIKSGGNVGIGTTSPAYKLTLQGASNTYATSPSIAFYDNIVTANARNWMVGNIATDYGSFNIASSTSQGGVPETPRLTINKDGNVGIGTTSPTFKLQVNGTVSNTNNRIFGTNGLSGYLIQQGDWLGTAATNLSIASETGNGISFFTNGTVDVRMFINTSGSVGIGTTAPTEGKLVVANSGPSIIYNKETSQGVNSFWNSSDGSLVQFGVASNHPLLLFTNGSERMRITSGGNVGIGTTSPVSTNLVGSQTIVKSYNGDTPTSTTAQAYDINQSNLYLFGRNAGLTMVGNASEESIIAFGNPFAYYIGGIRYDMGSGVTGGDMKFQTGGANERMRITSGGSVGIGTSSPGAYILALDYNASAAAVMSFKNSSASGYSGAHLLNNSGTLMGHFGYGNASTPAPLTDAVYFGSIASKAVVFTTNDTERMRITSGGDLLVGTTNSSYSNAGRGVITVSGTSQAIYGLSINGTGKGYLYHEGTNVYLENSVSGGFFNIAQVGAGYISLNTNGSERMRITSGGTVQPGANGTQDLGSSSLRWATVYTSDLDMSNGVGDYTIVEGEEDLFLYNNKTNKVFKFVIQEVDPSEATPKMKR